MTENDELLYLNRYEVTPYQYLIGIYEPTITFYKQQIRAINIFYLLMKHKKINQNSNLAVIGAGIAGLTFTSLALKCGMKVRLFEQKDRFLSMQDNCTVRRLHPNINDWPVEKLQDYADLPVLSWHQGFANEVVKEINSSFHEITTEFTTNFIPTKSTEVIGIIDSEDSPGVSVTFKQQGAVESIGKVKQKVVSYDLAILALGYGVEIGVPEGATPSYWDNNTLAQSKKSENKNHFISGQGDGALTELFGIVLKDYDILTIYELLCRIPTYPDLYKAVNKIKEDWIQYKANTAHPIKQWLYDEFDKLDELCGEFYSEIQKISEPKIEMILYGKEKIFPYILHIEKASMINLLLSFILFRLDIFNYQRGDCEKGDDGFTNFKKKLPSQFLIRHGTQKKHILKLVSDSVSRDIEKRQLKYAGEPMLKLYDTRVLEEYFRNAKINRAPFSLHTKIYCTSFLHYLNGQLQFLINSPGNYNFRMSLYRVIQNDKKHLFQQITPYIGTTIPSNDGSVGRVFSYDYGAVGLALRSGTPLLIMNRDADEIKKISNLINLKPEYAHDRKLFIAIPILALNSNLNIFDKSVTVTNLIFFLDCTTDNLTDNHPLILHTIFYMLQDFVNNINRGLVEGEFKMGKSSLSENGPLEFKSMNFENNSKCVVNLTSYSEKLKLYFDEFQSFDMEFACK